MIVDVSRSVNLGIVNRPKIGVIFIDCWDSANRFRWLHPNPEFSFYGNMIRRIKEFQVDSYVFATSFLNLDIIRQDVVNYFKTYVQANYTDTNLVSGPELIKLRAIQDLVTNAGDAHLAPELNEFANSDKSMFMPSFEGLRWHIQNTGINHWIVVGQHWGICTHTKPCGFHNLIEYKKTNNYLQIYSLAECTAVWVDADSAQARLATYTDYGADSLNWSWDRANQLARIEL